MAEKMTFAEKVFADLDDEVAREDEDLTSGSTKYGYVCMYVCMYVRS
jgi:hypothetical protein